MKILVINLLRLGDVIQSLPIVEGLKQKHPGSQVDLLVHSPVQNSLRELVPSVHQWLTIDREELQAGLGRRDIPLLTSMDVLSEFCQGLKYDLVVNLSHTQFSGWVAGLIDSPSVMGLKFDCAGRPTFGSPWFRYLNENADRIGSPVLHHLDVFAHALEIGEQPREWRLSRTEKGRSEYSSLGLSAGEHVVIQALTSDVKKNWSFDQWREFVAALKAQRPNMNVTFLASPAEREKIQDLADSCGGSVAALSLEGALVLLDHASLLVTGDTSIKHLANGSHCKILEICLGSSDHYRTGAYRADSLIVQSRVACAPCRHSSPCNQTSHLCASEINALELARVANLYLENRWADLARSSLFLNRTLFLPTGFWAVTQCGGVSEFSLWIEGSVKKLLFNGAKEKILKVGSEGYSLGDAIAQLLDSNLALSQLDFLEESLDQSGNVLHSREREFESNQDFMQLRLDEMRQQQIGIETGLREIELKNKLIQSIRHKISEGT